MRKVKLESSGHLFLRRITDWTVNADRYVDLLNSFFLPPLWHCRLPWQNIWFQQDGTTAHTTQPVMEQVQQAFPERVFFRFGDILWPPQSPDLAILDYFFWDS